MYPQGCIDLGDLVQIPLREPTPPVSRTINGIKMDKGKVKLFTREDLNSRRGDSIVIVEITLLTKKGMGQHPRHAEIA